MGAYIVGLVTVNVSRTISHLYDVTTQKHRNTDRPSIKICQCKK